MLYTHVTSQFLPDSDHSDYLVNQLQDIGDVCSMAIPNITVRALPSYDVAPPTTIVPIGSSLTTSSVVASPTCTGQMITASAQKRAREVHHWPMEARQNPPGCDALSIRYGVTTGDLQTITQSDTCAISGSVCLPAACRLQQIPDQTTW